MRNPIGSPVIQKTTENIAYTFDWSADGTPSAATVAVVDRATGAAKTLSGSPSIVGDTVVTQQVGSLTEGHTYNMTCVATIGAEDFTSVCVIICTDGPAKDYLTSIKLVDIVLEVARMMGTVRDGEAESGGLTSLVDTINRTEPNDYFNGGSIFIRSGSETGAVRTIADFVNATATLSWTTALSVGIAAGVEYSVMSSEFTYANIKAAINSVLRYTQYIKTNTDLVGVADTLSYKLPVDVNNIKRVEVAMSTTSPYYYVIWQNWKEELGNLVFDQYSPDAGLTIKLWYESAHGQLLNDDVMRASVDIEWLKWKSVAWLYRDQITRLEKDKPIDVDLLNEAKQNMADAAINANARTLGRMSHDPKLAIW
jgi:hypothetical protein